MKLSSSTSISHIGRRSRNEDFCCARDDLGLFAVADGIGGAPGGEVASRIGIESLCEHIERHVTQIKTVTSSRSTASEFDRVWGIRQLEKAVHFAELQIERERTGVLSQMGSTIAAMFLYGQYVHIAHVGDSRVYRMRGQTLELLTHDHRALEVWREQQDTQELRLGRVAGADGYFSAASPAHEFRSWALRHGYRRADQLTRALGVARCSQPSLRTETLAKGDTFLLCTDGLTDSLSFGEIERTLRENTSEAAVRALRDRALAVGGTDNITIVAVNVQ